MIKMVSKERNLHGNLFQSIVEARKLCCHDSATLHQRLVGGKTLRLSSQTFRVSLTVANYSRFVDTVTNELKFVSYN